jgi:hypothetical protein
MTTTMPKTTPTLLSIALLALAAQPAPAMLDPEEPADEPDEADEADADRDDEAAGEPDRDERDERDDDEVGPRPDGMTIGLGAGYQLPAQLDAPNVVSARLRLSERFTVEPTLELSRLSSTDEFDGIEATTSTGTYAFGADLRTTVASRGRNDLIVVGGASLVRFESDPDGENNSSSSTTLRLEWGLAIDTWIAPWLAVSATATNPLLTVSDLTTESEFGEQSESQTAYGAIWDPRLVFMAHLFW